MTYETNFQINIYPNLIFVYNFPYFYFYIFVINNLKLDKVILQILLKKFHSKEFVIIAGNFLSQFEYYLYWAFIVFITSYYFPDDANQILAISSWSKLFFSYAKLFGSLFFGYLTTKYSPNKLLTFTFWGIAVSSLMFIINPGFDKIGILSTYFLLTIRFFQSIFQGGETGLSNLQIMEINKKFQPYKILNKKLLYNVTTMLAISFSYFLLNIIEHNLETMNIKIFRIIFFIIFLLIIVIIFARKKSPYITENTQWNKCEIKKFFYNKNYLILFVFSVICQAFPYSIYVFTFFFLDHFVALNNIKITSTEILSHNSYLLLLDVVITILATKAISYFQINLKNLLITLLIITIVTMIPIFRGLLVLEIKYINIIKFFLIFLGVICSLAQDVYVFQHWKDIKERYFINPLIYGLGTKLIGGATGVILLQIWNNFHNTDFLALYLIIFATANLIALAVKIEHKN